MNFGNSESKVSTSSGSDVVVPGSVNENSNSRISAPNGNHSSDSNSNPKLNPPPNPPETESLPKTIPWLALEMIHERRVQPFNTKWVLGAVYERDLAGPDSDMGMLHVGYIPMKGPMKVVFTLVTRVKK